MINVTWANYNKYLHMLEKIPAYDNAALDQITAFVAAVRDTELARLMAQLGKQKTLELLRQIYQWSRFSSGSTTVASSLVNPPVKISWDINGMRLEAV